ncbi:hypothetical protein A5697_06905 [Mycobacterium sp. E3251]|uniref:hypothetical protein n=1 Tax=unclassified Mycobacterium TaxID=2642494 RepID=UPI0008019399|nr:MULTISPECIES: hypothetical protein [unclassified Mycobacterium]OBG92634.1 hypothetical protein A5697_06905 [Mycobacterium sp. E3251]OBI31841.1 hypothetical protein A5709_01800 [Mycobacterium sp. E1386]
MNNPSPGPGWWLASDGKWYPQQWEYTWDYREGDTAMDEMKLRADELGRLGWEMVGLDADHRGAFSVACFFKRPIAR